MALQYRVGQSGCPHRPPSEPYVKVSLHTAQAFQWTYPLWHAPVNSRWSHLCHTHRRPNGTALLTPALRRTKRLASLIICFSRLRRLHRLSFHSRPDRRGHIRCVTHRPWLLRSSQGCLRYPALRSGRPRPASPGATPFPLAGAGKRHAFGGQEVRAKAQKAQRRAADPDGILSGRPRACSEHPQSESAPEPGLKANRKEGKVTAVRPGSFNP